MYIEYIYILYIHIYIYIYIYIHIYIYIGVLYARAPIYRCAVRAYSHVFPPRPSEAPPPAVAKNAHATDSHASHTYLTPIYIYIYIYAHSWMRVHLSKAIVISAG